MLRKVVPCDSNNQNSDSFVEEYNRALIQPSPCSLLLFLSGLMRAASEDIM